MINHGKTFILGLDGLECDFVEKWNLTHLKQKEYGEIRVPVDAKRGVPLSPEVWASFLTGMHVRRGFKVTPPPLEIIFKILKFLRRYINLSLGLSKRIREVSPMHTGVGQTRFPPLNRKTFVDVTNSKEINAPYYSYDNSDLNVVNYFGAGKLSLEQTVNTLKSLYEERKNRILGEETRDVDVVFAFMHFPDALQHLLLHRPAQVKRHYYDLDNYVSRLKSRIGDSTLFLIVSDHGFSFETGTHSKHGFYSSNGPLNPRPSRITDFCKIITKGQTGGLAGEGECLF